MNILDAYNNKIHIQDQRIGKIQKNGKIYSYKRAFATYMAEKYNVTDNCIINILIKNNV